VAFNTHTEKREIRDMSKAISYQLSAISMTLCLCVSVALVGCGRKAAQVDPVVTTNKVVRPVVPLPPAPVQASIERAVSAKMAAMSVMSVVVAPPKTNAVIGLRFVNIDASAVAFRIYNTNGALIATITNDNCILTGYAPGQVVAFYATAVNARGMESEQTSQIAICTARARVGVEPYSVDYARTFSWPCAPGVTNVLQESDNLFLWSVASRFRGTNGTASVTLTNQSAFHRVLVQNATNVSRMTLTQQTAFVMLAWNTPSAPTLLEREVNAATGSFVTIQTNLSTSGSTVLPYLAGAKYRLAGQ
jgi:hypothetical protein